MNEDHLRLSDAERDAAAADLAEHFAQGRLSPDEHAERLDRIWAARTRGEIPPIFKDLPSRFAPLPPTRAWTPGRTRATPAYPGGPHHGPPREMARRSRGMPAPLVIALVVLGLLTVVTHLPLILVGLLIWFVMSSGRRQRSRSQWPH